MSEPTDQPGIAPGALDPDDAPRLATPWRIVVAFIPSLGFLAIPFLPFAQHATLWFGLPAVLVWTLLMVILSVAALQIVDVMYKRAGGSTYDDLEEEVEVP
jgi:uncharacterized protein (DUF983 family)